MSIGYLITSLKRIENLSIEVVYHHVDDISGAIESVKANAPDFVGLSIVQLNFEASLNFINSVKQINSDIKMILGGHEPSKYPEEMFNMCSGIDVICIGEAEETLYELVQIYIKKGSLHECDGICFRGDSGDIVFNQKRALVHDLDSLGFPERNYFKNHTDFFDVLVSRDCHGNCTFCCKLEDKTNQFIRSRSISHVLDEIGMLIKDYGAKYINFYDGTLTFGNDCDLVNGYEKFYEGMIIRGYKIHFSIFLRAELITDIVIEKLVKLRTIGLDVIFIGFESGNSEDLKLYGKRALLSDNERAASKLTHENIPFMPGFIMFNPYSTFEKLRSNMAFIKKHSLYFNINLLCTRLNIYSGTSIVNRIHSDGLLKCEINKPILSGHDYNFMDAKIGNAWIVFKSILDSSPKEPFDMYLKALTLYSNLYYSSHNDGKKTFVIEYQQLLNKYISDNQTICFNLMNVVLEKAEAGMGANLIILEERDLINNFLESTKMLLSNFKMKHMYYAKILTKTGELYSYYN